MEQHDRADLTSVTLEFGLELYKKIAADSKISNLFLSPITIFTALTLTSLGARGDTAAQMRHCLRLCELRDTVQGQCQRHIKLLNKKQKHFQIEVANRMYVTDERTLRCDYVKQLKYLGTDVVFAAFKTDCESEVTRINQWVAIETKKKVKRMITYIHPETEIFLINAVYFKGTWTKRFDTATREGTFTLLNGERVSATMMHVRGTFRFARNETLQCTILELTYSRKEKLSMLIFLPDRIRGLEDLETSINSCSLDQSLERLSITTVDVFFPRFSVETRINLADFLPSLGMSDAFGEDRADFSGIGGPRCISELLHKAVLEVNECGIGATASEQGLDSNSVLGPTHMEYVCANHPFFFLVKDNRTDMVLFLGRVTHPGGKIVSENVRRKYVFSMPI